MKLYTKTGDKGQTSLIGGTRVAKNDVRIEAYGTVDELNSFIGLLTTYDIPSEDKSFLQIIQNNLFVVGSYLATDMEKVEIMKDSTFSIENIKSIEQEIDRLDSDLPQLSSFILPGGSQSGTVSHICRTISRRSERRLFDMNESYKIDEQILIYFNRLSDYFFILSRYLTIKSGSEEISWKKHIY
jgi:cob(I)alamin adenosyltransferase